MRSDWLACIRGVQAAGCVDQAQVKGDGKRTVSGRNEEPRGLSSSSGDSEYRKVVASSANQRVRPFGASNSTQNR